jgi:hypothetical protein
MKLKNNTLQELYDTIPTGTLSFALFAESPIDEAFKECDRELTNLQNRNDILEKSNGTLLSANLDLATKKKELEKEVEDLKKAKLHLEQSRLGWVNRANKSVEEFNLANKEITELKNRLDKANADRTERENEAIRELVDVRSQLNYCTHSRDNWRSRAKYAEDEIEALKKDNKDLEKRLMETTETFKKANADRTELQKDRDSYHGLYTELRKDYDKLFEDNRKLKARTDCHRYEVEWYRKHYKEQSDKIKELKSRLNSMCGDERIKNLNDGLRDIGYDQGQTDLWDALQNVNDTQPNEFDVECESMHDVVSMDLEDFLDIYKKWQEQKETDRMREWLVDFCWGRVCEGCPLESKEYKCGRGYSFRKTDPSDLRIIPDKDIKRYYEKAHGCGRYTLNMEGTRKAIAKACDGFRKAVRDADTKITENLRKGCTFEAEVNVNKDLFEKLCGMKSEEEKPNPKGLVITTRGVTTANYTEATMNAIKEAVRELEKSLPALDPWESTITGSIKVDDILR